MHQSSALHVFAHYAKFTATQFEGSTTTTGSIVLLLFYINYLLHATHTKDSNVRVGCEWALAFELFLVPSFRSELAVN